MSYRLWIHRDYAPRRVPSEVFCVERQNMGAAMNIHGGNDTSIMYLNARNSEGNNKPTPFRVYRGRIWQHGKKSFDKAEKVIRLFRGQSKPILVDWSSRDIPEFDTVLRNAAQPMPIHP